ncbi:MAG: hypothetical protein ABR975_07000 [Vulcanimicrobiaceae bacterium]|jgi:hypothetical protein
MDLPKALTRRSALRVIAALPAALVGAVPVLARAQSIDALKVQYHFVKSTVNRKQKCFFCAHYTRQTRVVGTCSVLQTQVDWEGHCTAWAAKTT